MGCGEGVERDRGGDVMRVHRGNGVRYMLDAYNAVVSTLYKVLEVHDIWTRVGEGESWWSINIRS